MLSRLLALIFTRKNLLAFLRPFMRRRPFGVSAKNKINNAYFYGWDESVSRDNHIATAQLAYGARDTRERKR